MTQEQIEERRRRGMTFQEIGAEFGVSRQRVHQRYYGNYKSSSGRVGRKDTLGPRVAKKKCVTCGIDFFITSKDLNNKSCSRQCYLNTHRVKVRCLTCGKIRLMPKHEEGRKYCSMACLGVSMKGKPPPYLRKTFD